MSTAHDMIEMLRRHYLPEGRQPGWLFAPEVQAPRSTRRADLICMGMAAATGHRLVGHEVKVTRADLLVELADPTKSDPWQRFCDQWWLVLPAPAMLDGLAVPDSWGVMLPPSGRRTRSMTIHRPAPTLNPEPKAPALHVLAAREHWSRHNAEMDRDRARQETQRARDQLWQAERQQPGARLTVQGERRRQNLDDLLEALRVEWGDELGGWDAPVDAADIAAALRDLGKVRHETRRHQRELDDIRSKAQRVLAATETTDAQRKTA